MRTRWILYTIATLVFAALHNSSPVEAYPDRNNCYWSACTSVGTAATCRGGYRMYQADTSSCGFTRRARFLCCYELGSTSHRRPSCPGGVYVGNNCTYPRFGTPRIDGPLGQRRPAGQCPRGYVGT